MAPLPRPVQFVLIVYSGICTGIVLDFLQCLGHLHRIQRLHVDLRSVPLFVASVSVFIGILVISVVGLEKIIDFQKQRMTYLAGFIVSALITGYFCYLPCN
jgi:sorbitol-specific phosphotransferase system component IIBC